MKATLRERNWDGVAAVVAAVIGLLALLVSGYTAYIERQQVRAQVWPYLLMGPNDLNQSLDVYSKGVGPAIVRSVEVRVDGKPQPDWDHILNALGLPRHHFIITFFSSGAVVSPGETVAALKLPKKDQWKQFHSVMNRLEIRVCYCSTLGECWLLDANAQSESHTPQQCPAIPEEDLFRG